MPVSAGPRGAADQPSLAGRVALVTGASRGLGAAIALGLAARGAAVAVNYHASRARAEEVVRAIEDEGGKAVALPADVADPDACAELVAGTIANLGGLDVLVNNAGITKDSLIYQQEPADWLAVMRVNFGGVVNCTRAAMGTMLRQRSGSIVNISSVMGIRGWVGESPYAASKAAINAFTRCTAVEAARFGVRANAVLPGFAATDLVAGLTTKNGGRGILRQIPAKSFAGPEDVANVVAFLAGPGAAYMTGSLVTVDGGASAVLGVGAPLG
ncbi:SDR family oxidoreductase [Solihabitans fulvus]|uniref:SDR family oxidoreductase n=1 Tax=Solihabitans fulvus TaxID=1892852 RepID=A0A5B2XFY3_9PSEU|nr:SDR family oxidoreductase [Solihabitans fulvus]KAA2262697.1 SDR family oxidoreductase [Solihabitans fulvus]